MRVLLDTNVLFSMMVYPTPWTFRLEYELGKNDIQLFVTDYSISELQTVVSRKSPSRTDILSEFFSKLPFERLKAPNNPSPHDYPYIRDEDDLPILAAAIDANIDYLISGDKDFLSVKTDKLRILSPREFLDLLLGDTSRQR